MRKLTYEDIIKNNVDTTLQYKALEYIKECLDLKLFKVYLYNEYTIKVTDINNKSGYFEYDEMINNVLYTDAEDYEREIKMV